MEETQFQNCKGFEINLKNPALDSHRWQEEEEEEEEEGSIQFV